MAKVTINTSTPFGNIVADAIQKLYAANNEIQRCQGASALIGGDGTALVDGVFGGGSGQGPDYQFALNTLATALASFMTTNSGAIETLDNGNVS